MIYVLRGGSILSLCTPYYNYQQIAPEETTASTLFGIFCVLSAAPPVPSPIASIARQVLYGEYPATFLN